MRRALWLGWLCLVSLPLGSVWAKGRVQEFKAPEDTAAEDEEKKNIPKSRLGRFREDALTAIEPEKPFPWRMFALGAFVLGVGGVVGWRYYSEMSEDLPEDAPIQKKKKKKKKDDAGDADGEPADG